jgi:uncharacterized membrane protein YdjX (TVP38/TMEM64 family)
MIPSLSRRRIQRGLLGFALVVTVAIALIGFHQYGIEPLRARVEQMGVWAPLGLFGLRFTSVVIPALPGTIYSILAGGLLGFSKGLITICLADITSCLLSFYLARRFGRQGIRRLVGDRFMERLDRLSQQHLERNFFLMTGFLMTGLFDFVSYGVGLTRTAMPRFAAALVISIALSNPPIVAIGAGLFEGGKMVLGLALLGVFALALITRLIQKRGYSV